MAATFELSASFIWQPIVQIWNRLPFASRRRGVAAGWSGITGRDFTDVSSCVGLANAVRFWTRATSSTTIGVRSHDPEVYTIHPLGNCDAQTTPNIVERN